MMLRNFIHYRIKALAYFPKAIFVYLKYINIKDDTIKCFLKNQLKYFFCCIIGVEKILGIEKKYYGLKESVFNHIIEELTAGDCIKVGNWLFKKMQSKEEYVAILSMYEDIFFQDEYFIHQNKFEKTFIFPHRFILGIFASREGPYEIEEVQIQKNDVVIDAGANMGVFSLLAAKKGAQKVFAFEPNPHTYQILRENVSLNKFVDIIIPQEIGLFSETCKMDFIQTTGNIGASRILDVNDNISGELCTVYLMSLDEWVKAHHIESVNFIKADIEGAERHLIKGAKETIRLNHPKLALCTYHLPDDREVLTKMILEIDPTYKFYYTKHKLFAW